MTDTRQLDALIVRNFADIESAKARIDSEIRDRLERESRRLFETAALGSGWEFDLEGIDSKQSFWIAPKAWRARRSDDDHDLFICLEYDRAGSNASWLETFVGSERATLLIEVVSDKFGEKDWIRFLTAQPGSIVDAVQKAIGIHFDPKRKATPFAAPVRLGQEALADAFLTENFETVFRPMEATLTAIIEHQDLLDSLCAAVRAYRA